MDNNIEKLREHLKSKKQNEHLDDSNTSEDLLSQAEGILKGLDEILKDAKPIKAVEHERIVSLKVKPSTNRLKASIMIRYVSEGDEVTRLDVDKFLSESGISYGISEEEITYFLNNQNTVKEHYIAFGKKPTDGKEGYIAHYYDYNISKAPKEVDNNKVDFKNLNYINNVAKDEVLCKIIDPILGDPGIDVFGQEIPPKDKKMPEFLVGQNTYISEDGKSLLASTDGCVVNINDYITVESVYEVKGNVDGVTGNIRFNGTVKVSGNVREGFEIDATGDVIVYGYVEGAKINCNGNIIIQSGCNGMNKGILKTKGDITAKFLENVTVVSNRNVCADVAIKSNVTAGGNIILSGKNRSLLSGNYTAAEAIYVTNIGSDNSIITSVTIDPLCIKGKDYDKEIYEMIEICKSDIKKLRESISVLNQKLMQLNELNKSIEILQAIRSVTVTKASMHDEIKAKEKSILELEQKVDHSAGKIIASGSIFRNTNIDIRGKKLKTDCVYTNRKIMKIEGEICFLDILPSDVFK